jgi:hypothetical protein
MSGLVNSRKGFLDRISPDAISSKNKKARHWSRGGGGEECEIERRKRTIRRGTGENTRGLRVLSFRCLFRCTSRHALKSGYRRHEALRRAYALVYEALKVGTGVMRP